jgi:hypothetical protein
VKAIKLFFIIERYVTLFTVALLHTSTGPAVQTAKDTTPDCVAFTAS